MWFFKRLNFPVAEVWLLNIIDRKIFNPEVDKIYSVILA